MRSPASSETTSIRPPIWRNAARAPLTLTCRRSPHAGARASRCLRSIVNGTRFPLARPLQLPWLHGLGGFEFLTDDRIQLFQLSFVKGRTRVGGRSRRPETVVVQILDERLVARSLD